MLEEKIHKAHGRRNRRFPTMRLRIIGPSGFGDAEPLRGDETVLHTAPKETTGERPGVLAAGKALDAIKASLTRKTDR
jgi:hypothetical protein